MRLRRKRSKGAAELDITPLIDIVFQLLIFFMLSTNLARHRLIGVDTPQEREVVKTGEGAVVIQVNADGTMMFDGKPGERAALSALVANVLLQDSNRAFLVRPGEGVPLESAVMAYDDARKGGAYLISFSRMQLDNGEAGQ